MEKKFKIGDRVTVANYPMQRLVGLKGTIVATDKDGCNLVKFDQDVNTFSYCKFCGYKSDKSDLANCNENRLELI